MDIRLITKDELLQSKKIAAAAFEFKSDLEIKDEDDRCIGRIYGAFDEDNKMIAQMEALDHTLYFDGHKVTSTGIAGVSTLPEHRHKKAIRRLFEAVFDAMDEKGHCISQLYPFSFAYYNKFGYSAAYEKLRLRFKLDTVKHIERNNRCRLADDHKNPDLRAYYERYAARHNGAYIRDDDLWEISLSKNIYNKRRYPYVYYNEQGEAAGYFIFTPDNKDHDFQMLELGYDTPADLYGILGFIRNFEANYSHISAVNLPPDEDFSLLITNQYEVERKYVFESMTRIADVGRVLELMKYPQSRGCFTVAVDDSFRPRNRGVYRISYSDAKAWAVDFSPGAELSAADIEVSAKALARLVYGTEDLFSPRLAFTEDIKINGNVDVLRQVFVKKSIFVGDFF